MVAVVEKDSGERAEFQRLRKALGLSYERLARRLDRSTSTVIRYEKGITRIPGNVIELLQRFVAEATKKRGRK